ncbi:hypothetical protein E4U60_005687 [Claviceps pazoutovae]|uniref:Uncharacterized protein n=1 Tax=Claviceps pazoutovae TaxID=1649127 RepID=A0A9P7M7I4_9HYPO|nr:hypothetical protein E4U60_005687 [Claviceps pazoutovae]
MCPNVTLHCQGKADEAGYRKHHHDHNSKWLCLLWAQVKHSIGWCFKITLLAYGYTFVGKGASKIYKQLEPIQGSHVPVFLGAIDLRKMNKYYWIDIRVHVVHFMFLPWGGHHVEQDEMVKFEIPLSSRYAQTEEDSGKTLERKRCAERDSIVLAVQRNLVT